MMTGEENSLTTRIELGQDLFLVKTDESGGVYWVESAGGFGEDEGFGIALDTISDQLYIGMDFDQNAVVEDTSIITFGDNDFILAAYLDTFTNQVVIPPTSVYNQVNESIQLYPNPASDYIKMYITSDMQDMTLVLTDVNGQVLESENMTSGVDEMLISTEQYVSGNYLIAIVNRENRIVGYKRFVKR